jgi:hypothetical protein
MVTRQEANLFLANRDFQQAVKHILYKRTLLHAVSCLLKAALLLAPLQELLLHATRDTDC